MGFGDFFGGMFWRGMGFEEGLAQASTKKHLNSKDLRSSEAALDREYQQELQELEKLERSVREEELYKRSVREEELYKRSVREEELYSLLDEDLSSLVDDFEDGEHESWVDQALPKRADLAAARDIAEYLTTPQKEACRREETCFDCAFWHGARPGVQRCIGCRMWGVVQVEYGGSIRSVDPATDKLTCSHFSLGTGRQTRCYDCVHWRKERLAVSRIEGCAFWSEHLRRRRELTRRLHKRFGSGVNLVEDASDYPYVDEDICYSFKLDRSLPAGYGLEKTEQAQRETFGNPEWQTEFGKAQAKKVAERIAPNSRRIRVSNAGAPGCKDVWKCAKVDGETDINLVREFVTAKSSSAVDVFVAGEYAGSLPEKMAAEIAPLIDAGRNVVVQQCAIQVGPDDRAPDGDYVSVWLTVEWPKTDQEKFGSGEAIYPSLPSDTYYLTDELLGIVEGPELQVLPRLNRMRKEKGY